jgi:hypothetical protein
MVQLANADSVRAQKSGGPAVCAAPAGSRSDKTPRHVPAPVAAIPCDSNSLAPSAKRRFASGWRRFLSLRDPAALTDQRSSRRCPPGHPTLPLFVALVVAGVAVAQTASAQDAPLPLELQPYRVRLQIGFEDTPQFSAEFRAAVLENVRDRLTRYVGAFWQWEVNEEKGEFFTGLPALKRLRVESLPRGLISDDVQKVYLLQVQNAGAGASVAGREWDLLTRQLSALAVNSVYDRREIAETVLAILRDLFRPIAAIEPSKSGPIKLRARGGEFPSPDESWRPLSTGRIFEAFYCFLDKDRAVERVQQVPFTYLSATEAIDRGTAAASATSGLRAPLVARRRIQPVALGTGRRGPETRLTLITRPPARKPLAGVEVEIADAPTPPEELTDDRRKAAALKDAARFPRLVADRNGLVVVSSSAAPAGQPVWLYVRSGQALLARVPFLPGVQATETLELPDDTLRLETEGRVALLQAELVDAVARRAVLLAQAKGRAKNQDWDGVAEAFSQIDGIRKAPSFTVDVNAIRIPALKLARARRDRTTAARIEKLCDETLELVNNYLDEEKVKELRDELAEMHQLAKDEAGAEARAKAAAEARSEPEKKMAGGKKKTKKKAASKPAPAATPGAAPAAPAQARQITIEGLVTADPLPPGYTVTRSDIVENGELRGRLLSIANPESQSNVKVGIDVRDFTARGARVAAAKDYVNTGVAAIRDKGWNLTEQRIPDLDNNDFQQRVIVELFCEDPDNGEKLTAQLQIFFAKSGYSVVIIADNRKDYDMLCRWALSLKEKAGAGAGAPAPTDRPSF